MKACEGSRRFPGSKNKPAPGERLAKIKSAPSSSMLKINLAYRSLAKNNLASKGLISLCSTNILVSSANNNSCNDLETSEISFIYIRNKMGTNIEPCATPHLIPNFADCKPL